jgi:hypothetical protein
MVLSMMPSTYLSANVYGTLLRAFRLTGRGWLVCFCLDCPIPFLFLWIAIFSGSICISPYEKRRIYINGWLCLETKGYNDFSMTSLDR